MSAIGPKRTFHMSQHLMSLSGVKRTCRFALQMSAFDPKQTKTLVRTTITRPWVVVDHCAHIAR